MFYKFLYSLKDHYSVFNVFQYITFRVALAAFTSFVICILLGPRFIRALKSMNIKSRFHEEATVIYEYHKDKAQTPSMGGLLILISVLSAILLWGDLSNLYVCIALFSSVWLATIGFIDDYKKSVRHSSKGISAKNKFMGQAVLALIIFVYLFHFSENKQISLSLYFPLFKSWVVYLGPFYIFLTFIVIVGSSNAVNLTDGLDGLAVGCSVIAMAAYAVLSYIAGHSVFSAYLHVPFVPGAGELTVFCASVVGAGLGFLWYNCHPADIFMGDTGSLFLGGTIGVVALLIKQELLLILIGGVFVLEALSVIFQVLSFKITKKRIFLVAPIHHHFQAKGWDESRVITRFWIVAFVCAVLGLAALKLR